MELIKVIIFLVIGFIVLIKSSDIFVEAISSIAAHFKMSKMMIALTAAAFGTCAPELAISFTSMASNAGDIALSNVMGSNIANILLIIGLGACITPIKVKNNVIKKELPILVIVTSLFSLSILVHFISTGTLTLNRVDGVLYLCLFLMFMFYIVSVIRVKKGIFEKNTPKYSMLKSIIYLIVCCILIVIASDVVVINAKELAKILNVTTKIVTMTFVVIGTSLPELTLTVIASRKKEFDIALGNIIGTNIFNIGVVLGLPLMIFGGFTSSTFNLIDILFVLISALVFYMFAKNDKVLSKIEGLLMIILCVVYYFFVFTI